MVEKRSFIFNFKFRLIPKGFLIFLILAILFEGTVYFLAEHGLLENNYEAIQLRLKGRAVDKKNNYDVIMLGDCAGWAGIRPIIFEKILPLTSYNFSINVAQTYLMSYIMLSRYLRNCGNKPKLVILQISGMAFLGKHDMDLDSYSLRRDILPYFRVDYDIVNEFLEGKKFESFGYRLLTMLPSLREQYFFKELLCPSEIIKFYRLRQSGNVKLKLLEDEKGFFNQDLYKTGSKQKKDIKDIKDAFKFFNISQHNLSYIEKILSLLSKYQIKAIICTTPVQSDELVIWENYNVRRKLNYALEMFARRYNNIIAVWDMSDIASDKQYFFDQVHLNSRGADLYTNELASKIKRLLVDVK